MLIVEGPDGAGKTSLIEKIEALTGLTREPRAVSAEAKSLVPIDQYVLDELKKGFGPRIYDRFALISSPCYTMLPNPTFQGKLRVRPWYEHAWQVLRNISPTLIICLPPLEVVLENVAKDESSKWITPAQAEQIYWNYYHFSASYPYVTRVWDYTRKEDYAIDMHIHSFKVRLERESKW